MVQVNNYDIGHDDNYLLIKMPGYIKVVRSSSYYGWLRRLVRLVQPRLLLAVLNFKCFNGICMLQCQSDFIQSIKQTMLAMICYFKVIGCSVGCGDSLTW